MRPAASRGFVRGRFRRLPLGTARFAVTRSRPPGAGGGRAPRALPLLPVPLLFSGGGDRGPLPARRTTRRISPRWTRFSPPGRSAKCEQRRGTPKRSQSLKRTRDGDQELLHEA